MASFNWRNEIDIAAERIRCHVRHTPLEHSMMMSEKTKANVYIKLESEQLTGSFKVRGAFNKCLKLKESGLLTIGKGPTFASTGNHAIACNVALRKLGARGTTYVPDTISPGKEATLRRFGADIVKYGSDCMDSEVEARRVAQEEGRPYMSPYNDQDVVVGQGTIGCEIYEDLQEVDAVFVPVGGGGLIGGIAAYLKAVKPDVKIIGCQPINSKVMYESVRAGKLIFEESFDTLSDGTAGGIEGNAMTFDLCRDLVDEWVLVNEDQIADAVYLVVEHHHKIVEGATGLSVGAFLQSAEKYKDKNVVIIACGANIDIEKLKYILNRKP